MHYIADFVHHWDAWKFSEIFSPYKIFSSGRSVVNYNYTHNFWSWLFVVDGEVSLRSAKVGLKSVNEEPFFHTVPWLAITYLQEARRVYLQLHVLLCCRCRNIYLCPFRLHFVLPISMPIFIVAVWFGKTECRKISSKHLENKTSLPNYFIAC